MTRSKRMDPVLRVAEHRERDAARALGESRQRLEHQRQRLQELLDYREEYSRRFQETAGGGMDMNKLHEYRAFLGRLNDAVDHQHRSIAKAEAEVDRRHRDWLELCTRLRSLDTVRERFRRDERQADERREQRDQDERVSAAAARPRDDGDDT